MGPNFQIPEDGYFQFAKLGRFPSSDRKVVQIIDKKAVESMVNRFNSEAGNAGFGGILIDYDHFSHDVSKSSEAAGWITTLEARSDGLWGKVKWSQRGLKAVEGGNYRNVSPAWMPSDCEAVGPGEIRLLKLHNVALTNCPNIPGMIPITNRTSYPIQPKTISDSMDEKTSADRFDAIVNCIKKQRNCPTPEAWQLARNEAPELYQAIVNRNASRPSVNATRPIGSAVKNSMSAAIRHQGDSGNNLDPNFEGAHEYDSLMQTLTRSYEGDKQMAVDWIRTNRPELVDSIRAYYGL